MIRSAARDHSNGQKRKRLIRTLIGKAGLLPWLPPDQKEWKNVAARDRKARSKDPKINSMGSHSETA
ncbi:MAG: hypothetical protein CW346_06490 [Bacillaceae bacterium]|nr:hypothetical protein [Bacillaceae bacterium]